MDKVIEILKYLFLGFLQGVCEILPISSSGHLMVAQKMLNINENATATFTILLHFASLLALLIYFRKVIGQILKGIWYYLFKRNKEYKEDFMLAVYVIIASIPVGIVGVLFEDKVESIFSNLLFVGISFIFTAFVLLLVSNLKNKGEEKVTLKSALITGFAQLIGIFPGVSRSGMTMSGARVSGLEEKKAKEFAFLLFIPVAVGSFIFSLDDAKVLFSSGSDILILSIISMISTFIFTYLALLFIFKKFENKHYKYFSIYLVCIGIFTILFSFK